FLPRDAGVRCFIDPARGPSVFQTPWMTHALIACRVQRIRVIAVDHEINCAGLFVYVENLLPGDASISGLVDSTLFIRGEQVSYHCDVDDVWIRGMNDDTSYVLGIAQAHVLPVRTAIDRFVNAVSWIGAACA